MRILMVCSELAPLAKAGGLADATEGLSRAVAGRGHDVRVLLPSYGAGAPPTRRVARFRGGALLAAEPREPGPLIYLLGGFEHPGGAVYAGDDSDALRFLALCEAAFALWQALGWMPEIVHCHDWHAAPLTVMLRRARARGRVPAGMRSVLTLHNIGYQGVFPKRVLTESGHGELDQLLDRRDPARSTVNFLRAGIAHADALTTVSPTYAGEIQTAEYGMGLEDLLHARRGDLTGILNGVDYRMWSPESDPYLASRYTRDDPGAKRELKARLCAEMGLDARPDVPLIGLVSRLVPQKGIDLLLGALPPLVEESGCAFALLGAGERSLAEARGPPPPPRPGRVAFLEGYDEARAHHVLAGSDLLAIPSRYEPCGLTQLYALRYGTIPVVRATGGLADTIRHFDPVSGEGNGSVFLHADVQGLVWGVRAALEWFGDARLWQRLMRNAMAADFSWSAQIGRYEAVYRRARDGGAAEDP